MTFHACFHDPAADCRACETEERAAENGWDIEPETEEDR